MSVSHAVVYVGRHVLGTTSHDVGGATSLFQDHRCGVRRVLRYTRPRVPCVVDVVASGVGSCLSHCRLKTKPRQVVPMGGLGKM